MRLKKNFTFTHDLREQINRVSGQSNYGFFMILLSGMVYLLSKYTLNSELKIGIPVLKQSAEGMETQVGGLIPLQASLNEQFTGREWLNHVKNTVTKTYASTESSKVDIAFPAVISLNNIHHMNFRLDEIPALVFEFHKSEESISLKVDYHSQTYTEESLDRIVKQLTRYLHSIVENPDIPLDQIDLLSEEEKQQILEQFNDTSTSYQQEKLIHQWLEDCAASTPDKVAVYYGTDTLTYRQLNDRANSLARTLRMKGVCGNALVAIMALRSPEMLVGIMAILKAGGAYVPIDPTYPMERIRYILDDSEAQHLLTQSFLTDTSWTDAISYRGEVIALDNEGSTVLDYSNLEPAITSRNAAYVIYTSGSTGQPKGVVIQHHSVINRIEWMQKAYPLKPDDVVMQKTPFTFDVSVWELFWWSLAGASVHLLAPGEEKDPERIIASIHNQAISTLHFVPSMFHLFLDFLENEPNYVSQLNGLKYVFCSGEALQLHQVERFQKAFGKNGAIKLVNLYGPTEATVDVSYFDCSSFIASSSVPIGKPIDNIRLYIVNSSHRLLPIGMAGELCIAGAGLAQGYLHRPEMTASKFVADPFVPGDRMYLTGDLARWLPDGNIEYLGRSDQQVKIRGYRIECGEVEALLLSHPMVKECLVVAGEDATGVLALCAYIVADQSFSMPALKEYAELSLPAFMVPAFFVLMERMPLTANGKLDRKALPLPASDLQSALSYIAPRSEIEQKLAEIWGEMLHLEQISIEDSFFVLGGHSIAVIRMMNRVNRLFNAKTSIKHFYINPTIQGLANMLEDCKDSEMDSDWRNGLELISQFRQELLQDQKKAALLPKDTEDFYPLSSIQQSMVFYSMLRPEEPIYHDLFYYLVHFPDFKMAVFREALRLLTLRHPVLRTTIHLQGFGQGIQIVHSSMFPDVKLDPISDLSPKGQEAHITRYMNDDISHKFKFDTDLLWRIRMFQLSEDRYCMVLSFQHAILDGYSVASFNVELMEIYRQLASGSTYPLPDLQSSYKDYVAIQLSRKMTDETKQYWRQTLADYSRNKLPFNSSGKKIKKMGKSVLFRSTVEQNLLHKLEDTAKAQGVSLKEICFSAHLYLMKILTAENEVLTGIVTHDRPMLEDSERILGCFLNTVPIRMIINTEATCGDFIGSVNKYLQTLKPHELFLADISQIVGEHSNQSVNPFFDTLFNYTDFDHLHQVTQDRQVSQSDHRELSLESREMTNTLFDLEISRTGGSLNIQIKYSTSYFYSKDIETAYNLYLRILSYFVEAPSCRLQEMSILSDNEKKTLVYDFNNTKTPYSKDKTMHGLFEEQALRTPNQTAVKCDEHALTYKELNERANQLAHYLSEQGVQSGDHVGIMMDRSIDLICGLIAILKAGGVYVPIDPEYPEARQLYIAQNAEIKILLVDAATELPFDKCRNIQSIQWNRYATHHPDLLKTSTDLAYIIFTSGSTGTPKGVMIEHHSAVNLIEWVNSRFEVCSKDVLLWITSVCFDLSVYDIFGILASGGKIVVAQKNQLFDLQELTQMMQREQITFWDSVPSTMNHLVHWLEENNPYYMQLDLRLVFMSGDWIPTKLPNKIPSFFPEAKTISLGGATEATVWSNYYPISEWDESSSTIPYGKPIANNYFYILDESLNPVPWGVIGELYIGGVGVSQGYLKDIERTQLAFIHNPFILNENEMMYKTGDLGRMQQDGQMEFLGRKDHQVKIRGFRVELGEIESLLAQHESIRESVVLDYTDAAGHKYLCAYVVFQPNAQTISLREYILQHLPAYMVPSKFIPLDQMPLTPNGKINRKALPQPDALTEKVNEYVPPQNELEEKLILIWKAVLNEETIGVTDNFFELGGHSLNATTLISRINKECEADIALVEIFNRQTVREIAEYIYETKEMQLTLK